MTQRHFLRKETKAPGRGDKIQSHRTKRESQDLDPGVCESENNLEEQLPGRQQLLLLHGRGSLRAGRSLPRSWACRKGKRASGLPT